MAWQTPNERRHTATQEALRGILSRLCDLESAPTVATDVHQTRHELTDIREDARVAAALHADLADGVGALEKQASEFVIALAEGIERTDRAERRIKATVARARKELKARGYEDPGLESEAFELRERDGEGGDGDGVLPMHPTVEEPAEQASSIRGVSVDALRRARGWP